MSGDISDDNNFIEGFGKNPFLKDDPSGICIYFRENLPIKRRVDLETFRSGLH